MANHNCSSFVPPSSLKDLLDLFAKLAEKVTNGTNGQPCKVTDPTKEVLEELKNRLTGGEKNNGWIRNGNSSTGNDGIDWFYKDGNTNGTGCVMPKTILGLKELRTNILNGNGQKDNTYTLPDANASGDPCIKKYADAIIQNAFPLFGCLVYLWFI